VRLYRGDDGGLRVVLVGLRVHHGLCGVVLAFSGVALAWHDRRDMRRWLDGRSH
jgi:hypothetical protein